VDKCARCAPVVDPSRAGPRSFVDKFKVDPLLDPIRNVPQFKARLARMKFPPLTIGGLPESCRLRFVSCASISAFRRV
jgi:hypothetical protein